MATYRNPNDSMLYVSDYSYQPPPPYTALQTSHHRPVPPKPLIIEDIKDERRRYRSGSKKSPKDDRYDRRYKSHKVHRSTDYSRSSVSVAAPPPARTDLHLRQPVISERAPVFAVPSHSLPIRTNDPLPAETVREGTQFYDDICTAIDRAASTLDLSTNPSRSRDIDATNTYAYYQDTPRTSHQNNTSLQLDEIVPDATTRENVSSKVYHYANSRLPRDLMPFRAYMETYRLLSIAARYSLSAYTPPSQSSTSASEIESHIPASFLTGTKAMVLKSIPVDNQNTLVFAIRGSSSFADWAVNFRPAPASPSGFLDDAENYCHSGFLSVARSMVRPVAARLRELLEQDPSRCNSSLLITGHSAGGAVAALLYAHMLSQSVESELTILTNVFRRVHCVTFGGPPVSLLPLTKPNFERYRKWCFFGVINQGDPVVRASKEYVASLARLWLASVPAPRPAEPEHPKKTGKMEKGKKGDEKGKKKCAKGLLKVVKSMADLRAAGQAESPRPLVKPVWNVPPAQLSCAGRLVLLREKPGSVGTEDHMVEACAVTDEMLRGVIFGEAAMHSMSLYARRTEMLAFRAVTGREG
ncbi:hypothetical protein KVT40_005012 [Elsinoe batatas]|uniref:Fungal lipase-type domain-containing protein n=1 Tax=Elsinoe batatas TaxID=2601811 RepID=A0A8K0L0N8_9PEZI|nr:hypothetical protein KVT40_005012 [Elsinoe batatas]